MILRPPNGPSLDYPEPAHNSMNDPLPPSSPHPPNLERQQNCPQAQLVDNGTFSPANIGIQYPVANGLPSPMCTAQTRAARFARLRDALYYSSESAGFILSADEKLVYPSVSLGQPPQKLIEVENIEEYIVANWECWDAKFERRLHATEYPVLRVSRERKNFHGVKVGCRYPDGKRTIFTARGQCIYDPDTREFIGSVTWLDESVEYAELEKREQEEALRSFETICNSLPHMVWTARPDGTLDYVSKSWMAYTGLTLEEARDHGWMSVLHPEDVEEAKKFDVEELSHSNDLELHLRYRRNDRSFRWTSCKARPYKDDNGKVMKWYGTITDVHDMFVMRQETETLQAENARLLTQETAANESSRLKGQFLAHMSHELRTPIAGVIGMVSLLRDTPMTLEQYDYADCIKTSANNLLTIVNDILDYSKIESGRLQIEEIPFSLTEVIENIGRVWKHIALQRALNFEIKSDVPSDLKLLGDPTRVGQVLNNLWSNALKFTSKGSIMFCTHVKHEAEHVDLQMVVEDTGSGIEENVLAALFTPFQQGDSSTARKHGGTGLGLTISRSLAQLMHGHLVLESERSKGTKATLSLKLKRAVDDIATSPELPAQTLCPPMKQAQLSGIRPGTSRVQKTQYFKGRHKLGGTEPSMNLLITENITEDQSNLHQNNQKYTILIAEDNIINQRIAVKTTQKLGYRTFAVVNGQEALDFIANPILKIDVVLMDCQMPLMDGYEATRRLRTEEPFISVEMARRPDEEHDMEVDTEQKNSSRGTEIPSRKLKDIPVIALTASAIPGDREKCFEAGMDDYMTKPLNTAGLQEKLLKWAGRGRRLSRDMDLEGDG